MENSNKKHPKTDSISKVEEPALEYKSNKIDENSIDHPLFAKLIEKSIQQAEEGKLIPHEEVMKRIKEKFPFLK